MTPETKIKSLLAFGFLLNLTMLIINVHDKSYFWGAISLYGVIWMSYLCGRFQEAKSYAARIDELYYGHNLFQISTKDGVKK